MNKLNSIREACKINDIIFKEIIDDFNFKTEKQHKEGATLSLVIHTNPLYANSERKIAIGEEISISYPNYNISIKLEQINKKTPTLTIKKIEKPIISGKRSFASLRTSFKPVIQFFISGFLDRKKRFRSNAGLLEISSRRSSFDLPIYCSYCGNAT